MKIRTRFDLIERAALANKGFTLKKYAKDVISAAPVAISVVGPLLILNGASAEELKELAFTSLKVYSILYGGADLLLSGIEKNAALEDLRILANQLGNIYVDTNAHMLTQAKAYKTEYKIECESFPPKVVQHKYIMVPVHNDWGNNERSLHQEHAIGSKAYDLSYGEPEKEKVYSYKMKRVINK